MDPVFLEGAGAAAVASEAEVCRIEAEPGVARSRKVTLVGSLDHIHC